MSILTMNSPVGLLRLTATDKGLSHITFVKRASADNLVAKSPSSKFVLTAKQQLMQYFDGKLKAFDVPLDLQGTDFQRKVWQALLKIPFGKTASYKDIAKKIGHEKAMRAVGSANGKNPVCIVVPCHRVIAHDGSIGGYSGGLPIKKYLLKLEQSIEC